MKKNLKPVMLIVVLLAVGIAAMIVTGMHKGSYELKLPEQENLAGITIEKEGKQEEITDGEEIKNIIYILYGSDKGRNTKEESISDAPVNVNDSIKVDFNFAEKGTSTLFVYKKGGQYYIEQPYNGIYRISGDEYDSIEKYIN